MTKQALLIFAKNPEAGKVKTRLAATIGDEAALAVYHQLLLHTVSATERLPVDKFVFYSNHIEQEDMWNSKEYHKEIQQGNDLGGRMKNAFTLIFQKNYGKAVIIGTDCPDLHADVIMNAFAYLDSHDAVIGPAEDGGYYLLGIKKVRRELFENIKWSTSSVLHDTISRCAALQISYCLLPELTDIDDEKDLTTFKPQRL